MKKHYHFEIHHYAPELSRVLINGNQVPNYVPKYGTYEEMIRGLRLHFKPRVQAISVTIEKTGATSKLPDETFKIGKSEREKKFFLKWLRGRYRGVGRFVVGFGDNGRPLYEEKEYSYKIKSVKLC